MLTTERLYSVADNHWIWHNLKESTNQFKANADRIDHCIAFIYFKPIKDQHDKVVLKLLFSINDITGSSFKNTVLIETYVNSWWNVRNDQYRKIHILL